MNGRDLERIGGATCLGTPVSADAGLSNGENLLLKMGSLAREVRTLPPSLTAHCLQCACLYEVPCAYFYEVLYCMLLQWVSSAIVSTTRCSYRLLAWYSGVVGYTTGVLLASVLLLLLHTTVNSHVAHRIASGDSDSLNILSLSCWFAHLHVR